MQKLTFSGHDTFHCRHFWLKKGYDFVQNGYKFSANDAVVYLGVGKNMVSSIRYWMKAFNMLTQKDELTEFAHFIFGENGVDPYLENKNTIWLLHYLLVKTHQASIYNLVFNGLLKERYEFSKEHIYSYAEKKGKEVDSKINPNTLKDDVSVFLRNYHRPEKYNKSIEDEFSGILIDLDLVKFLNKLNGQDWYRIEKTERIDLPFQLALFAILDHYPDDSSIPFYKLVNESIGNVFALNDAGILNLIKKIVDNNSDIIFTDDAGIRELQIKTHLDKWDILKIYYEN